MARVTVISNDLDTTQATISALDGAHDVLALGWGDDLGLLRVHATHPDVVVVDADVLWAAGASRHLRRPGREVPGEASPTGPAVLALIDVGREERIIPCFDRGADDYLLSPFLGRDLVGKVESLQAQRLGLLHTASHDPIAISDEGMILRSPDLGPDGIGAQLGRYEVLGVLGRGGYGVVYRARDVALGRDVALKVLPRELHDDAEAVARFFRESTAISRLNHPNIVRFYEVGSYRGRLYFTMELVEGQTLKQIADNEAPLPPREATFYVAEIAKALAAIDSIGLVHRDVKPENVVVTADGQVKLIDFGLVRIHDTAAITSQEDVLGTPYFMCPEYIREPGVPDIRYDLYALGVTFFHLLTGEYPFDGKNAAQVMERHLRSPAPNVADFQPGVPLIAQKTIERLLRKDPDRRPQTAQEVLLMLRPLLRPARRVA